jgi:hypothetical protein
MTTTTDDYTAAMAKLGLFWPDGLDKPIPLRGGKVLVLSDDEVAFTPVHKSWCNGQSHEPGHCDSEQVEIPLRGGVPNSATGPVAKLEAGDCDFGPSVWLNMPDRDIDGIAYLLTLAEALSLGNALIAAAVTAQQD